jgi:hypothetical protein
MVLNFLYRLTGRSRPVQSRPPRVNVLVPLGERGKLLLSSITAGCEQSGIPFFIGAASSAGTCRIHIARTDAERFWALLVETLQELPAKVYAKSRQRAKTVRINDISSMPRKGDTVDLIIAERTASHVTPILDYISSIELDFWDRVNHYNDEELYEPQRSNKYVNRVTRAKFDELCKGGVDLDVEADSVVTGNFPIDAVITWVNDQDLDWRKAKEDRAKTVGRDIKRAAHSERFRNRDELKYCLRSIEQFAPFIRKIFLVTAGQVPEWLDTSHPQLQLIDHRDIFCHKTALPTFNSSAIETQLHHIDGLAEHFLYFNDDFFLGKLCKPQDFFLENGAIKYFPSSQRATASDIDDSREEYLVADRNAIRMVTEHFGRCGREIMLHVPYPSSKSLLTEMERRYQSAFDTCAGEPFRSARDIRPIAFMQYHYGFLTNRAVPSSIEHRYLALWKPTIQAQLDGLRRSRKYKTFCINDVGVLPENEEMIEHAVRHFLENYFPLPSKFEKQSSVTECEASAFVEPVYDRS